MNKTKRFAYVVVGLTWCLVGAQVVAGVSLIKTGGKKK